MINQPYPPDPRTPGYQVAPESVPDPNEDTVEYPGPLVLREKMPDNYVNHGVVSTANTPDSYAQTPARPVEAQVDVFADMNAQRAYLRYWVPALLYFLVSVLEVILGLRFLFRLFGARQGNSFIVFLYNLSHVFVAPFNGIFNDQAIGSSSVFEISTIVAMLIYALLGWGLVSLARVIFAPIYNQGEAVTRVRRR